MAAVPAFQRRSSFQRPTQDAVSLDNGSSQTKLRMSDDARDLTAESAALCLVGLKRLQSAELRSSFFTSDSIGRKLTPLAFSSTRRPPQSTMENIMIDGDILPFDLAVSGTRLSPSCAEC
jgi:hypothetical protein